MKNSNIPKLAKSEKKERLYNYLDTLCAITATIILLIMAGMCIYYGSYEPQNAQFYGFLAGLNLILIIVIIYDFTY